MKYKTTTKANLNLMVFIQEIIYKKEKDETYIINLDEYESIGTHWKALYVNAENITYFDSFEVEHVPKEIRNFIRNENITIIYRMQTYNSVMCGYFIINLWTIYLFYGRR